MPADLPPVHVSGPPGPVAADGPFDHGPVDLDTAADLADVTDAGLDVV